MNSRLKSYPNRGVVIYDNLKDQKQYDLNSLSKGFSSVNREGLSNSRNMDVIVPNIRKKSFYDYKMNSNEFNYVKIKYVDLTKEDNKAVNNLDEYKLLKSEQNKTSSLIKEIIRYRCEKNGLEAKEVLLDLYNEDLVSGSYIKKYLNINQYELMNLLNSNKVEYKVGESNSAKEKKDKVLRRLLDE